MFRLVRLLEKLSPVFRSKKVVAYGPDDPIEDPWSIL